MTQSSMPGPDGAKWWVTGQVPRDRPNAMGQVESGWTISYATSFGATGSVWVASSMLTPDNVSAMIDQQVTHLETISKLSG